MSHEIRDDLLLGSTSTQVLHIIDGDESACGRQSFDEDNLKELNTRRTKYVYRPRHHRAVIHEDEIVDNSRRYVGYRLCKNCNEQIPDGMQDDLFHDAFSESVDGLACNVDKA